MKNIYSLLFILPLSILVNFPCKVDAASYTWTQRPISNTTYWKSVAMSSDGTNLVTYNNGSPGGLYTSTNSGTTWIQRSINVGAMGLVASSANGLNLVVVQSGGKNMYFSSDGGVTWPRNSVAGTGTWIDVASAADGIKLAAVGFSTATDGYLYTSSDQGVSWVKQTSAGFHQWDSISISADGTKIIGNYSGGSGVGTIISNDSGATWTSSTLPGNPSTQSPIGISSDNNHLIFGGIAYMNTATSYVYLSSDGGVTWNIVSSLGRGYWYVATSADGKRLVASQYGGYIYTSSDSGVTWNKEITAGSRSWGRSASSQDGRTLAVIDGTASGSIWTATFPSACPTSLSATADSGGFHLFANISNFLLNALGFNFCISNSSSNHYFIPTKTPAELQSFINAVPRLNGVSTTTQ